MFNDDDIILAYTLDDAIADGVLFPIMQRRWHDLSDGKPIVVTRSVAADVTGSGLVRVWNEYVHWHKEIEPTLPEEERLFTTTLGNKTVWVIEDGAAFTILYPEDY
jgi:hypothetical protein